METRDFTSAFDQLPGFYLLVEANAPVFTIQAANQAFLKQFGLSQTDVLKHLSILSLFEEQTVQYDIISNNENDLGLFLIKASKEAAVSTTFIRSIQLENNHPLGVAIMECSPLTNNQAHPNQLLIQIKDIARSALAKTEERYRTLFQSSPMPMWIYETDSYRFLEVNDAAIRHYGYSKEEFLQKSLLDILPQNDWENVAQVEKVELDHIKIHKGHWRHYKKNGELIDVEVTAHHIQLNTKNCTLVLINDISERLQIEEQKNFERYNTEALINNTSEMIWSIDTEFKLVAANQAFLQSFKQQTGLTVQEGDHVMLDEYFSKEFIDYWRSLYERSIGGESFLHEVHSPHLKGQAGEWSEVSFHPIRNEEKIIGVACYGRDVSSARRYQEELLHFNKKLEAAQQIAKLGYWEYDIISGQINWSKEVNTILDIPVNDPIPTIDEFLNMVAHEELDQVKAALNKAITEGKALQIEHQIRTRSGQTKNLTHKAFPIQDQSGNICRIEGILQDISEYKKTERDLFRSLKEIADYKFALDQSSIVAITDQKGIISYVNDNFCLISGYTKEELIGKDHRIINSGYHPKEFIRSIWTTIANGNVWRGELKNKAKNGSYYWVDTTIVPFLDDKRKPYQYVAIRSDITQKKEKEERLRLMEMAIANSKDAVVITTAYKHELKGPEIIYVNKAFTEITGYEWEEIVGKTPRILQGPLTDRQQLLALGNAMIQWQPSSAEIINYKKNGDIFWNSFSIAPVTNEQNELSYWVAIERDVTERKRAEEMMRDSEEKRRLIMNAALDAIICIDTNGMVTFWNPQAEKIFGWKDHEVIGQKLSNIIIPEAFRNLHDSGMEQYMRTGYGPALNTLLEFNAVKREGSLFPIELTVLPIKQDSDEFFCAFIRDITDRRRSEVEIRNSNERYELVAKATSDAIWDWNIRSKTVVRPGDGLEKLFGYDSRVADADYHFWDQHVHPDDLDKVRNKRNELLFQSSDQYWEDEYRFKKADGSYAVVYDRGYVIRNKQGEAIRMIGSTQDITELKRSEQQLLELNQVLERRATELSDSNNELERFAYVASHDLQEPLRMVSSFLQLLEKQYASQLDDKAREYINFAVGGAERMKRLILDLLTYSRVGMQKQQFAPVDMNQVLKNVMQIFSSRIEKENIHFTANILPEIWGSASHLQQLMQNLIGNAIKYKGTEAPEIEVGYREEVSHYIFFIRDNGIGINEKYFEKIFVVFQRLHPTSQYSGTGIGLAICKKIVDMHQGTIWVESEEQKGSTFFFSIPKPA
jgi:PAS domain S-box-containing protein